MQGGAASRPPPAGERPPLRQQPPPPAEVRVPRKPRLLPTQQQQQPHQQQTQTLQPPLDLRIPPPRTLAASQGRPSEPTAPLPQGRGPSPPPIPRIRQQPPTKLSGGNSSAILSNRASLTADATASWKPEAGPRPDTVFAKLELINLNTRHIPDAVATLNHTAGLPPLQELEAFVAQLFLLTFCNVSEAEYLAWQPRSAKHAQVDKRRLLETLPPRGEVIKYGTIRRSAQAYFHVDMKEVSSALRKIVTLVHDSMNEVEMLQDPAAGPPPSNPASSPTQAGHQPGNSSPSGRFTNGPPPANRATYRHERGYSPTGPATSRRYATPPRKYSNRRGGVDSGETADGAGGRPGGAPDGATTRPSTGPGGPERDGQSWFPNRSNRYPSRDTSPPPSLPGGRDVSGRGSSPGPPGPPSPRIPIFIPPPVASRVTLQTPRHLNDAQPSDTPSPIGKNDGPRIHRGLSGPRSRGSNRAVSDRRADAVSVFPLPRDLVSAAKPPPNGRSGDDRRSLSGGEELSLSVIQHDLSQPQSAVGSGFGPTPQQQQHTGALTGTLSPPSGALSEISPRLSVTAATSPLLAPCNTAGGGPPLPGVVTVQIRTAGGPSGERQWPEAVLDCRVPTGSRLLGAVQQKSYHQFGVKRTWAETQQWVTSFELDDDDLSDVEEEDAEEAAGGCQRATGGTSDIPVSKHVISCKKVVFPIAAYGSSEAARMAAEAFTFKVDKSLQCDLAPEETFAPVSSAQPIKDTVPAQSVDLPIKSSQSTPSSDAPATGNSGGPPSRVAEPVPGRSSKRLCRTAKVPHTVTPPNWRPNPVWNPAAHCATCTCPDCNQVSASMHCRTCVCKLSVNEQRQHLTQGFAAPGLASTTPGSTASGLPPTRRSVRNGPDIAVRSLLRSNTRWDVWLENLFAATGG